MTQTMNQPTTQMTLAQALEAALQQLRAGQLQTADTICREVLEQMPEQSTALHMQAMIARQLGRMLKALSLIQRAVAANPTHAEMHCHLGIILRELNRLDEAMSAFGRAVELKPDIAEAHANMGDILGAAGRDDEAATAFARAVAIKPDYAEAWNNFGVLLRRQKKSEQAAGAFKYAVDLRPTLEQTHTNLGNALADLERWEEAQVEFEHAVRIKPDAPLAWTNLGLAMQKQGRLEPAVAVLQRAVALQPDQPEWHMNLGNALRAFGRLEDALAAFNCALALKSDAAHAYSARGDALHDCGRHEEAIRDYEQALTLQPGLAPAHLSYAHALLLRGDYANGLEEYEWRFSCGKKPAWIDRFTQPLWDGGDVARKRVLLHSGQSLGEVIQCVRYGPLLADRGAQVILECHESLARLMSSVSGIARVYVDGKKLPRFHLHSPMMSLPYAFTTTLKTIPADVPYLLPDPAPVERWRQRIERDGSGLRVGLIWSGDPEHFDNPVRSIPLSALAPLWQVPGVRFYSLQKGPAAEQSKNALPGLTLIDHTSDLKDLAGTAALMANLDLVITVCASVAHLAGATGKKTWLLLDHVPDWRWLLNRTDSPWYPTMRLFRQPIRGDWASVVEKVKEELGSIAR